MRAIRLGGPHYPDAGPPGATVARPPAPTTRAKGAQPTEEELRNIRRASRAAASDAAWLEEQDIIAEELASGGGILGRARRAAASAADPDAQVPQGAQVPRRPAAFEPAGGSAMGGRGVHLAPPLLGDWPQI